eukprot:186574-Amphidinium_carterae.1
MHALSPELLSLLPGVKLSAHGAPGRAVHRRDRPAIFASTASEDVSQSVELRLGHGQVMHCTLERVLHIGAGFLLRPRLRRGSSLCGGLIAGGCPARGAAIHPLANPLGVCVGLVQGRSKALHAQLVPYRLRDLASVRRVEDH